MRVPISWLNEYASPDLSPGDLAEKLALSGTEVERVEHHGVAALEQFVVGKVLERKRHPDADRLSVCMVDTGGSTPSQIVCGAPNVAAGQIVAVAKPGAILPDGTRLNKARLRGVESNGMILAEDELALGTDHSETLVLNPDLKPGTSLTEVLPIATDVLVLEITPNRPDCLAIYGVAREVHAATGAPLNAPPWAADPGTPGELQGITITVERSDLCPRFTARIFENVHIGPSPLWLKQRLMAAGQRPISNVVDITNYVMLLTGQPLHAFDLDRVAEATLTVRMAQADEQVETLDGQTRALDEDILVIADGGGPTSIAGIMGGARSEVHAGTTRVLMEAANWEGANLHRSSLKLGLRSEASTRFEKQIQPEQALQAQAVATQLMIELTGATVRPGTVDIGGDGPPLKTISLRDAKLNNLLGTTVSRERSREILTALEFECQDEPEGLEVTVPAFRRADVNREADLIEEVSRLDGVEKLPATLPSRHNVSGRLTLRQRLRRRASDDLSAQGLHEIVGWSFVAPEIPARLRTPEQPVITLANPMSSDQSQLRTALLGSLLDSARSNRSRGLTTLRLFEAGAVYLPSDEDRLPFEPYHVAALLHGAARAPTWREPAPRDADFFAAKGVLGGMLDALMVDWTVRPGTRPFLHPGRSADVLAGDGHDSVIGWVGEIHPLVAADWELDGIVAGFEIDLDALPEPTTATYVDLTSFPEVREDLAVVIPESVSADELLGVIRESGQPLLAHAEVFDVYRDPEKLGAGNVSLAVRLAFRAADRTLTDAEVASQRESIIAAIADRLEGTIRGG